MLITRHASSWAGITARRRSLWTALVLCALVLTACQQGIPKDALQLNKESLNSRQLQTRQFDTLDESKLLSASAGVLQDLGFTIDESETKLGLIVASKDRDATNPGQVAMVGLITLLNALGGQPTDIPYDVKQKVRVSLVTRPIRDKENTAVRATFQRSVWNSQGQISLSENLAAPELYQEFFDKLSKAVFLEAHQI